MVIQVDSILDAHIRSFFVVTSSSLSEIFSLQMSWKLDNNRPLSPPLTHPKKITETSCPGSCNNQKVQKKVQKTTYRRMCLQPHCTIIGIAGVEWIPMQEIWHYDQVT
jgi:hypothetical protein